MGPPCSSGKRPLARPTAKKRRPLTTDEKGTHTLTIYSCKNVVNHIRSACGCSCTQPARQR